MAQLSIDVLHLPLFQEAMELIYQLATENPQIQAGYYQTCCAWCGTTTNVHTEECLTTRARALIQKAEKAGVS